MADVVVQGLLTLAAVEHGNIVHAVALQDLGVAGAAGLVKEPVAVGGGAVAQLLADIIGGGVVHAGSRALQVLAGVVGVQDLLGGLLGLGHGGLLLLLGGLGELEGGAHRVERLGIPVHQVQIGGGQVQGPVLGLGGQLLVGGVSLLAHRQGAHHGRQGGPQGPLQGGGGASAGGGLLRGQQVYERQGLQIAQIHTIPHSISIR